jgi:hypothetical protein
VTASTEPQPGQREIIAELLARHFCPEYGDPAYVEEFERHGMKIPDPVDQSTMVSFIADDGHRSLSTLTFGDIADALVSHGWGPKPTVKLKRIQEYGRFDQLITDYLESRGIEVAE